MKNLLKLFWVTIILFVFASCQSVTNKIGTTLSGADKKGVPVKAKKGGNDMMLPLVGESDPVLMEEFFPTALKLYEILYSQNPKHQGLATMTGSLYVMYANAFIQSKADMMPIEQLELQTSELQRAKLHYLRGRDYVLKAFEMRYPGFNEIMLSNDNEKFPEILCELTKDDVEAAYWCGAGWLGAFGVDPLDVNILSTVRGGVALLERAAELDPEFDNGSIWDALTKFYAAAPADFGGDSERAVYCYEQAVKASGGKTIGPYLTYAESFCIPTQDLEGFDKAIEQALAINPDDNPSTRLATTISRRRAEYLKAHREDYFIIW